MKKLFLILILFTSCSTYKRVELVNEWKTSYNMVFTVERVKIYDRKTDTIRLVRMDTTVQDYTEWKHKKYFKVFDTDY